ncbi:MAG: glycosyltransferase family 4 protein [Verrucomicrobiota bacterium]
MKILLLAPHPFYQDRGTPIAVDLLARTLAARGESVDILAYHEGEKRDYPENVTVRRIAPPPGVKNIRPGLSAKKLVCDAGMMFEALSMAGKGNYDVIHAVEESVFMAMLIKKRRGIPYIFDMDSSMPAQMAQSHPFMKIFLPFLGCMEKTAIRGALSVVPMCRALAAQAVKGGAADVRVLHDIPLTERPGEKHVNAGKLPRGKITFLYLGNLEQYQGADLMLNSLQIVLKTFPEATLIVAGGAPNHIAKYKAMAARLGAEKQTHFLGPKPTNMMKSLFEQADILLSPRLSGTNTPMKIYSYMASGKPVVATNLPTHTQVLNRETAALADPYPSQFAAAMIKLAGNPELRRKIGNNAKKKAAEKYSHAAFVRTVNELYDYIRQQTANTKQNIQAGLRQQP